jgi:hypothetical protein
MVAIGLLQPLPNAPVQHDAPCHAQPLVRYLLIQGMLKCIVRAERAVGPFDCPNGAEHSSSPYQGLPDALKVSPVVL